MILPNFYLLLLYILPTVISRCSLRWFNGTYIQTWRYSMWKAKRRYCLFLPHVFLFPLKSISTHPQIPLMSQIFSGVSIKSILHSAPQRCLYIYTGPFSHVLCVYVAVVYLHGIIRIHLYSIESYSAWAIFCTYGCSINSWEVNQSHLFFLQKPIMSLHC